MPDGGISVHYDASIALARHRDPQGDQLSHLGIQLRGLVSRVTELAITPDCAEAQLAEFTDARENLLVILVPIQHFTPPVRKQAVACLCQSARGLYLGHAGPFPTATCTLSGSIRVPRSLLQHAPGSWKFCIMVARIGYRRRRIAGRKAALDRSIKGSLTDPPFFFG